MGNDHKIINEFIGDRYVIVVEPTPNYRVSIKQFLHNLRVNHVKIVANSTEARRELDTVEVGLLIIEWNLPEINGLQFCRSLRKNPIFRDLPIILLSVENLKRDIVLASEVGIAGYMLKPFSYEDFCLQMRTIATGRTRAPVTKRLLTDAEALFEGGDLRKAWSLFAKAAKIKDDSARAHVGMARILIVRGKTGEAVPHLKKAIEINPQFIDSYRTLLEVYETQGNQHGILHVVLRLHEISPDNPTYTLKAANAYLAMNELENSEEFFRRSIRLSPKLAGAFKGLGDLYMAKEDYETAMKNYHKALDIEGDDLSVLNSIALSYVKMDRFEEGVAKYNAALKLAPENVALLFNVGYAYEKWGKLEEAKHYYNLTLIQNPDFIKARRRLVSLTDLAKGKT